MSRHAGRASGLPHADPESGRAAGTGGGSGDDGDGRLQPTGAGPLAFFAVIGLILGWSLRPLSLRWGYNEPVISTGSVLALFFLAALVAVTAYVTWRGRRDGVQVSAHHAVNKLVLGKACARLGAAVFGGYLGFAIAHIGVSGGDQVTSQIWHASLAAAAGALLSAGALLLEHACRVPPTD